MKDKLLHHNSHYFIQFLVLIMGFSYILLYQGQIALRLVVCALTLALYCAVGLFHHKVHHSLDRKIVLEYVLISLLLFSIFFFSASSYL